VKKEIGSKGVKRSVNFLTRKEAVLKPSLVKKKRKLLRERRKTLSRTKKENEKNKEKTNYAASQPAEKGDWKAPVTCEKQRIENKKEELRRENSSYRGGAPGGDGPDAGEDDGMLGMSGLLRGEQIIRGGRQREKRVKEK